MTSLFIEQPATPGPLTKLFNYKCFSGECSKTNIRFVFYISFNNFFLILSLNGNMYEPKIDVKCKMQYKHVVCSVQCSMCF